MANNIRLLKDRDYLVISESQLQQAEDDEEYLVYPTATDQELPIGLSVKIEEQTPEFNIQRNRTVLHCDAEKLSFPLTLRKWRKGDWFVPFGMKGKKKISDFFTDNKFTLFEKEETWVLLSRDDIVWIVNHRVDNRFRITDATKSICTINLAKQS